MAAFLVPLASAFEGKVEMLMTVGKDKSPMTYFMKGNFIRMEMQAPANKKGKKSEETGTIIMDVEALEMIILMDSERMYMVQKLSAENMEKAQKEHAMEFKPTGRKEKIAGIEAEEFVGVSKKQKVEVWVTKELGKFMMANPSGPMGGGKKSSSWADFAQRENAFPLRSITRANKEGAPEDTRMEVVSIETGKQPDSLFKPPADYQKFEMPSMGDMMKGMIPGK